MSEIHKKMGEPKSAPVGVSVRRVWVGLLVFYAVALALNGVCLLHNNERLPYGPVRSFWVATSTPVAKVCEALGLDRPRAFLERTVGAALNE